VHTVSVDRVDLVSDTTTVEVRYSRRAGPGRRAAAERAVETAGTRA